MFGGKCWEGAWDMFAKFQRELEQFLVISGKVFSG